MKRADWDRGRLKWDVRMVAGGTPSTDDRSLWLDGDDPDGIPFVAIADMSRRQVVLSTTKALSRAEVDPPVGSPGTLLLAMYASVGEVAFLGIRATWNQAILGLTPNDSRLDSRFLAYVLLCMRSDLLREVRTSTQANLNAGQIGDVWYRRPPLPEQWVIADYLDRETAKIDALIEKQEQLSERLRERRTSIKSVVMAQRVGKGDRLRWVFTEVDKRASGEWQSLPLMSVSISWGVRPRSEVSNDLIRAEELAGYKVCEQNEVVVNRMRAFQGALGVSPLRGLVSPDYSVLNVSPRVNVEWLVMAMTSDLFVSQMASRVRGIGSSELGSARTPRINVSDLGDIRLAVPPLGQQVEELAFVSTETAKIDLLISKAERFIELAKERRAALITAAVTGQIDVRGESTDPEQETHPTEMESV